MWRSLLFSGLAFVVLATGLPAQEWEQQVRGQLQQAALTLGDNGYRETHRIYTGWLYEDRQADHPVTLDRGVSYAIVGSCDDDCGDLDLKLYDENWNLIDSDTRSDASPVVEVTPEWTGTFYVRVIMADCSSRLCRYGVGVFGR